MQTAVLRDLDPPRPDEIERVDQGMRQTLIALYGRHACRQTVQGPNDLTGTLMIQLSKPLLLPESSKP